MAVRVGKPLQNFTIPIEGLGVELEVRPLTTAIWEAAHAKARRVAAELRDGETTVAEIGGRTLDLPDLEDPDQLRGFQQLVFAQALGCKAIVGWSGVLELDSDETAPVTENNIMALMMMHKAAEDFVHYYTEGMEALLVEGKGLGPSANGISAEMARTIAARASAPKTAAPEATSAAAGNSVNT